MSWMMDERTGQKELSTSFRNQMKNKELMRLVGAHHGLSGIIAKDVGFNSLYLSGGALSASKGLPDIGLMTHEELVHKSEEIIDATNLPLLVDIDTGYGEAFNVARLARDLVKVRVAAVQIEDQVFPKKCGHLDGKQLTAKEEVGEKIRLMKQAEPDLVIVARTDALAVTGREDAIDRAKYYMEAGADAIFPEAVRTDEEMKYFASRLDVPLLFNMTEFGKTPYKTAEEIAALGFSMVIYPVTSLRVAAKAVERVYRTIYEKGTQQSMLEDMQTRKELYQAIDYEKYDEL
ncbi:2-methylisocitrate lyase [Thalassobacillus devorans]|uniref:Methylisocitrate lyase n=1 Tax=Thalassobacillus devorans TaxID=279813 RepID=A0ABQ1PMJ3_9BACI|nr:methylisocitrate lyase [Thalassobacillus devorans]NIK30263.1 methylisocitrate lyase [Thalassobacillus devorans]GGC99694.1 2-methylisocitrate lyase [Thalassobacillus devorans]